MIVLNKKRILVSLGIVVISLFAFTIQMAVSEKNTIATVALPVSNKVIVIDAGHGVPDEGAQSRNGTTEAQTNHVGR